MPAASAIAAISRARTIPPDFMILMLTRSAISPRTMSMASAGEPAFHLERPANQINRNTGDAQLAHGLSSSVLDDRRACPRTRPYLGRSDPYNPLASQQQLRGGVWQARVANEPSP